MKETESDCPRPALKRNSNLLSCVENRIQDQHRERRTCCPRRLISRHLKKGFTGANFGSTGRRMIQMAMNKHTAHGSEGT